MATPDPNKPQVTDPATVADLARILSIRGALGVLDVADIIIPTISVGALAPLEVAIRTPAYRSVDVFSAGLQTAPGAGTIMADTGALPAGVYDVLISWNGREDNIATNWSLQHRNAANAANLMAMILVTQIAAGAFAANTLAIGYTLANNERLRVITNTATTGGRIFSATIFARIRN